MASFAKVSAQATGAACDLTSQDALSPSRFDATVVACEQVSRALLIVTADPL